MKHDDFDQDLEYRMPTDEPRHASPIPRSPIAARVLAALIVLGVIVTGYLVFRGRRAADDTTAPPAASAPESAAESTPLGAEAEPIDVPPLDESDDVVRGLVSMLSSNPTVAAWLTTDNLIRNFTVVVSNIASGEHASRHLAVLKPATRFAVEERGEDLWIDSRSYARFLPLTTAVSSIDPQGAARLYTTLKPRIEEAYRELGYPDTTFDQTLERAIVTLLRTPIPSGPVSVVPSEGIAYRFSDPALEKLTPAQKQLIRLGPDNARSVQTSLRNIALALGIPEERLR